MNFSALQPNRSTTMSNFTKTSTTTPVTAAQDRNDWRWGFTPQAEVWNGRLAMIGFVAALATELLAHTGVLHFWGLA